MGERSNRGIVSVSWSELFNGLKTVFWGTPKVMTILCVIVAALGTCLYGVYLLNVWQLRLSKEAEEARER